MVQAPTQPVERPPITLQFTREPRALSAEAAQTLVVTRTELLVFGPNGVKLHRFLLADIQECRVTPVFGAGLFRIKVDGAWLDLAAFSNRYKDDFESIARSLAQLQRGENPDEVIDRERELRCCRHCSLRLAFPGEPCPRCRRHGQALRRVLELVKPYWKLTMLLTLLLFLGVALDMVWPLLTRYLVDHVLTGPPARAMKPVLLTVVLGLVSVQVCRAGVSMLTARIGGYLGNVLTFDLRSRLVSKLGELGLGFYHQQQSGALVSKVMYDTESINGFINQLTAGFLMQVVLVVSSLVLMFSLAPPLALLALSPAPLIVIGAYVYWRRIHPFFQRYLERVSRQAGILSGAVAGIKVVKVFGQERREYLRFQESAAQLHHSRAQLDRLNSCFHPAMSIVFQAGGWLIWYLGGSTVLEGRITLGTLVAFFGYMSMFYGPLGSLTNFTTWLTQFTVQVHRLAEILDTPAENGAPTQTVAAANPAAAEIEFRDVVFGYARHTPILRKVSFAIEAGEHIGIIGSNGSGKTSIVNALGRLYPITSGQILLRGMDLRAVPGKQLRSELGVVLQECLLFRGSLLDNLTYGNPNAGLEEVLEAARAVNAHDFIMSRPLAYDSMLGEGGQGLSGGERQKINIARALLCAPRILVLDEATSQVDKESGLIIHQSVRHMMNKPTTLTIAHRFQEIADCDRVMVLERGRIVEFGSPAELLKQNGPYADWARGQDGNPGSAHPEQVLPKAAKDTPGDAVFQNRWLSPESARFHSGLHGELQLALGHSPVLRSVFAVRCFPVNCPEQYLSVRYTDSANKVIEAGLVADLNRWPSPQQALIRESVNGRYCLNIVERVRSIRKADQLLLMTVVTRSARSEELLVRSGPEFIQEYGRRGCLVTDLEEDLYLIPDITALPRSDQARFHRSIFWLPDLFRESMNSQTVFRTN